MRIDKITLKEVGPFKDTTIKFPKGTNSKLADVYLLTGPNGSGKSTVLYALADIIGAGHFGSTLNARRFRSDQSLAALTSGDFQAATAWHRVGSKRKPQIDSPFGTQIKMRADAGIMGYYYSAGLHPFAEYYRIGSRYNMDIPREARPTFSWAAFAYAGMRSVSDAKVKAIEEPRESPFENSLSFTSTANSDRLAQWIANQDFKRLKAKEAGRTERANQFEKSIRDIEQVVSKIIGEEFHFVTSDEDNNVRVQRNGMVTDLGVMPDGLKAIVSWIADLLMRLERIPWVDDTPPLQRHFLLLLDEVDIHLHPTWQRKVLPIVQRMFPNAQIIASTHSPFVVASAEDAQIITLQVKNGVSNFESMAQSQSGISYSVILRSIFGIDSEFDLDTEKLFSEFHTAKEMLLKGRIKSDSEVQRIAGLLSQRSEEVRELIAIELRQVQRQLKQDKQ